MGGRARRQWLAAAGAGGAAGGAVACTSTGNALRRPLGAPTHRAGWAARLTRAAPAFPSAGPADPPAPAGRGVRMGGSARGDVVDGAVLVSQQRAASAAIQPLLQGGPARVHTVGAPFAKQLVGRQAAAAAAAVAAPAALRVALPLWSPSVHPRCTLGATWQPRPAAAPSTWDLPGISGPLGRPTQREQRCNSGLERQVHRGEAGAPGHLRACRRRAVQGPLPSFGRCFPLRPSLHALTLGGHPLRLLVTHG